MEKDSDAAKAVHFKSAVELIVMFWCFDPYQAKNGNSNEFI